jgi:hypothetical protein
MKNRKERAGQILWSVLALMPIAILIAVNTSEILLWLQTGHCPAGPMDRPAAPCGPIDFILLVILGGWVSFIVIPILVGWWMCLLLIHTLIRFWTNRKVRQ